MLKCLIALLLTVTSFAQTIPTNIVGVKFVPVRITFTPEPVPALYSILHSNKVQVHSVNYCNLSNETVYVPIEEIAAGIRQQGIPVIPDDQAVVLLTQSYNGNFPFKLARVGEYLVIISTVITAGQIIKTSSKVTAGTASAIPVMKLVGDKLKTEIPDISKLQADVLKEQTLSPSGQKGYCQSGLVFSTILPKGVLTNYDFTVQMPLK